MLLLDLELTRLLLLEAEIWFLILQMARDRPSVGTSTTIPEERVVMLV